MEKEEEDMPEAARIYRNLLSILEDEKKNKQEAVRLKAKDQVPMEVNRLTKIPHRTASNEDGYIESQLNDEAEGTRMLWILWPLLLG